MSFVTVDTVTAKRDKLYTKQYLAGDTLQVGIIPARAANRFLVVAQNSEGVVVNRLLHGPWSRQTARQHARDFAKSLSN